MGRPIYYPCGWERGVTLNFNITNYVGLDAGSIALTATEADRQCILRPGGVIIRAGFYVTTNTIATSPSVFTLRVNGSDTGLTVSIGAGVTNQWVHSTGGPITIAAGDKVCWKIATPNTSGAMVVTNAYAEGATDGATTQWWMTNPFGSANGVTRWGTWMGIGGDSTARSVACDAAGTVQNLSLFGGANARAVVDQFWLYQNGATTAQTVSTTASTGGAYEDTSHAVTIAAGDTVLYQVTWGASAGAARWGLSAGFELAGEKYPLWQTWNQAVAPSTTVYAQLAGNARGFTTEADCQNYWLRPGVLSNVQLQPAANSITAGTTMTLRKNGVDTAIAVSIPGLGTSVYSDSDSVTVAEGDLLSWKLVSGAGGTSMSVAWVSMVFTPAPFTPPRIAGANQAIQRASLW